MTLRNRSREERGEEFRHPGTKGAAEELHPRGEEDPHADAATGGGGRGEKRVKNHAHGLRKKGENASPYEWWGGRKGEVRQVR